jgi:hypothetical protein
MHYANREIFMHLEVKMGRIESVRIANRADLLSASNLLTFSHENSIKVPIQRIRVLYLTILHKSMANHDHISPGPTEIPGQSYHPTPNHVDGITEIRAASSLADPILTQVTVGRESARNAFGFPTGKSKPSARRVSAALGSACASAAINPTTAATNSFLRMEDAFRLESDS